MSEPFVLNPNHPVEAAVIKIVQMQRAKSRDYAEDGSVFSNFETTADLMDQAPEESALFNVAQKLVRLRSLKANGRTHDPANEAVQDTYLDLAVYAVIAYAIVHEAAQETATEQRRELFKDLTDEINKTVQISEETKQGVTYRYTINTTGLSSEQVAAQTLQQLQDINWAAGRRQW